MLKINTISRPVFFVRDGKTVETNATGEQITQQEFATLQSDGEVVCVDENTGQCYIYIPGKPVVYATAVEDIVTSETPAPDAGRVPTDLPVGSKSTKA